MIPAAAARSTPQIPAGVWLHATDPERAPTLPVLAEQIADHPDAPPTLVTGTREAPGPTGDARALDAMLDAFPARLLVLTGDRLPMPLIERARARGMALMLVDAVNPVPSGGWRILPGYRRSVLGRFTQIHARDAVCAAAIARIVKGAVPVPVSGRLALFAPVRGCNVPELDALRQALGARPVWFAHDLPENEAGSVLVAHAQALRRAHRLLLIVQPRNPAAGAAIADRATDAGFVRARRSIDEEITETTQVYIADTDDDPGLFLRLAPVSYLGGSLTGGAGTPPAVTAAALGSALVFGPHADAAGRATLDRLQALAGGRRISAAADLGEAIGALLSPDVGAEAALKAWSFATEGSDATVAVARAICDWFALNGRGE